MVEHHIVDFLAVKNGSAVETTEKSTGMHPKFSCAPGIQMHLTELHIELCSFQDAPRLTFSRRPSERR